MRTNLKRAAVLGTAGLGAVALSAGFALPAMADDGDHTTTQTATSAMSEIAPWTDADATLGDFQLWVQDLVDAQGGDVTGGDITGGDTNVGNGSSLVEGPLRGDVSTRDILSGPIGSGNEIPVGSGNDASAPIGSGNDTSVEAPIGSGNDVGNGTEVGVGDVGAEVGDLTSDIGTEVGDLVGDVSSDVDDLVDGILGD
ncbi:hypothetical protein [Microbacterium telephonicum]|uniref:Uncharacterized protein n=1 Tax=Microbacterium telephonicum TaxID=1714841 RepID=A0A498CLH8_9MICO|nr:hypothetical protein [Microbacterium telephonicum]RLK52708.1 hypothetical protein C7474_0661 [Microbacterium telephonicum]